jgi:hypothetical protein
MEPDSSFVSKKIPNSFPSKFSITPYAEGSTTFLYQHAHEKTEVVNLHDENNIRRNKSITGAVLQISLL